MPGRTRKPTSPEPGLLDEGPYLHLDPDLLGNQGRIDQSREGGMLSFDNPDPSFSRGPRMPTGGGLDNSGILERIAAEGTPNPLVQGGPGPAKPSQGPSWINPAGVGLTLGDWNIGARPKLSTDSDLDDPGQRDRAQRQQQDAAAEGWDRRSTIPKK